MKLNLPNKITVLRIALVPVYIFLQLFMSWEGGRLLAFIVFIVAAVSDYVDGYIARKQGLVTNFGKLMDPMADKLLVYAALLCFVELGYVSAVVTFIIVARDLFVSSVRVMAAHGGVVLAAEKLGKVKTAVTMTWLIYVMFYRYVGLDDFWTFIDGGLMALAVVLTVVSGWQYYSQNKQLFSPSPL